jgi:hypothetical protein
MPDPENVVPGPKRFATFSIPISLVDDVAAVVRLALVFYNDRESSGLESSDQTNEVPDEVLQFWRSLIELAGQQQGAQTIGMLVRFAGIAIHRASEEMKRDQFELLDEIAQAVQSQLDTE